MCVAAAKPFEVVEEAEPPEPEPPEPPPLPPDEEALGAALLEDEPPLPPLSARLAFFMPHVTEWQPA